MRHGYPLYLLVTIGALLVGPGQTQTWAAPGDPVISEFMAANTRTLADEEGDFSDWVEIHNPGSNSVSLNGWYLTDNKNNLTKWQFPNVTLGAKGFLVVFASGKDRRTPGQPLHTGFQLGSEGEYLGLVKPDGATVTSEFPPTYPIQAPDLSYGFPVTQTQVSLIATGVAARMFVPANGNLVDSWVGHDFDDSSWTPVTTGVGYESDGVSTAAPTAVADSVAEFSGNQGSNNWFYGYWDKKADLNGVYGASDFMPFPRGTGTALNSTNYWSGTKWDWPSGDPPFIEMTNSSARPSGDNGNPALPIYWAIRRYVSETNGLLRLTGTLFCGSSNGICGDGVIGRIYLDGVQIYEQAVFRSSVSYSLAVPANIGSLIDFVIDPGPAGNDACDNTTFTAVIRTAGSMTVVADSINDWSLSGTQGEKNWRYGYFNRSNDPDRNYQSSNFMAFPSGLGPHSSVNYWDGQSWDWFDGDPPHTQLGQIFTLPNLILGLGSDKADEHWLVRRWVSEVSGTLLVDWHLAKQFPSAAGVGTVTGRVFHNNTQRDTVDVMGPDTVGVTRTVTITNVQVGDFIDFAVDPRTDGIGDACFFNATIHGNTTLSNLVSSNVELALRNVNPSLYLRIPFTVTDPTSFGSLTLRMKFDDGFAAYLNGTLVASRNSPEVPAWDSVATAARPDAEAAQFEEFSLTGVKDLLQSGVNVLAIQGMNVSAADSDFLVLPELRATRFTLDTTVQNYFSSPTPGFVNGLGNTNLASLILDVAHTPSEPLNNEDLLVTARVVPTFQPVNTVRLYYRIMYGSESNVVMLDDGLHGDGAPGDSVYGATIPNTISTNGQMIRYYITATDARTNLSRMPPYLDPANSSQYFGTVVFNPVLTNPLPVLHWFAQNPNDIINANASRSSMYFMGEFYDNIASRIHGQSSSGFPKKSYNVDFNPDHHFRYDPNEERVDDINVLTPYPDKAHMRNMLGYETDRDSGCAYHWVQPVRVQLNSQFHGDWHLVENGDNNYLKRIGRDPNGALYKMYDTMASAPSAEKKTRRHEDRSDLQALITSSAGGNANRVNWIYDNVNVAEVINFLASMFITGNVDCCHKNYYVYRDTEGTGLWEMLPWDVDLSFGRNWSSSLNYWDDAVYPQNGLYIGNNATLPSTMFSTPAFRQMYLRRVRTLAEQIQQTSDTPFAFRKYESRIDELAALIAPDAELDLKKWGTWGNGNQGPIATNSQFYKTLPQSVAELKNVYLPARRTWLFTNRAGGDIPLTQPLDAPLFFGAIEFNPASANQAQEYLVVTNKNAYAVDISGWKLSGAITHTFQGGLVIPSNSALYVTADQKAFRARTSGPRGGQGLFIEGNYQGQLSARGELLQLTDLNGRVVASTNYAGNASLPQQYFRITELMYHPADPAGGSPYTADDFEWLELKNTGPASMNLMGVHFSAGIDFTFTGSSVTNLAAGQTVLIVKNNAAFTSRYGGGFNIAGQYGGNLDNSGETLRLDDAVNEKILDFSYNNSWYPITDGPGDSLVIVNENALWNTWGDKVSWRHSHADGGSPGGADLGPTMPSVVLVNEVLTHTDPPDVDAIELYNPNTNVVNVGGWFISDDFSNPKKYRIPDNTMISAGGYVVFYETNFGGAFAFSSHGDEAYLFSGDGAYLTGFYHGFNFGAAENGVSFGRYVTSQGDEHFVAQSVLTFGQTNAGPKVGPVVVSEIMYRPPDLRGGVDNSTEEFVELRNVSGADVPLFDPMASTNTWQLRDAVDFDFPPGVTLPSGGYLLVVSFTPADVMRLAAFRSKYGIPGTVPVYGPYAGQLDNGGASVELFRPDPPDLNTIPYVLVDKVAYRDSAPWPASADGAGASLQRKAPSAYGNDPANWVAARPSAAAPSGAARHPPSLPRPSVKVWWREATLLSL